MDPAIRAIAALVAFAVLAVAAVAYVASSASDRPTPRREVVVRADRRRPRLPPPPPGYRRGRDAWAYHPKHGWVYAPRPRPYRGPVVPYNAVAPGFRA